MRLHWKAALCFMLQDPEWKTKIFVGGLWLLAFPPLGWPIALGYRKETLCGLVEGADATPAPVARAVTDLPTGGPQGGWDHPDLLCAVPAGILVDGDRRLVRDRKSVV